VQRPNILSDRGKLPAGYSGTIDCGSGSFSPSIVPKDTNGLGILAENVWTPGFSYIPPGSDIPDASRIKIQKCIEKSFTPVIKYVVVGDAHHADAGSG
jgi:hypothetical protein